MTLHFNSILLRERNMQVTTRDLHKTATERGFPESTVNAVWECRLCQRHYGLRETGVNRSQIRTF